MNADNRFAQYGSTNVLYDYGSLVGSPAVEQVRGILSLYSHSLICPGKVPTMITAVDCVFSDFTPVKQPAMVHQPVVFGAYPGAEDSVSFLNLLGYRIYCHHVS